MVAAERATSRSERVKIALAGAHVAGDGIEMPRDHRLRPQTASGPLGTTLRELETTGRELETTGRELETGASPLGTTRSALRPRLRSL